MPHATRAVLAAAPRASLYQDITDTIIGQLEQGCFPWVQPWAGSAAPLGLPRNAATRRHYSGINILILWGAVVARGFAGQSWLTFRQALSLGGSVRKGERGTTIVFADRFTPEAERQRAQRTGDAAQAIPFLKRFTVFNADQCEGLPPACGSVPRPPGLELILPQAASLIAATGADLRLGGPRAFYSPAGDYIQIPAPQSFFEPVNWHRTACHELGHWTGHESRLNRDMQARFGSNAYAREELVAEMCAAFVCASLGITPTVRHADYLGHWLEVLREDNRAIIRAASAASKAADYLLALGGGGGEEAHGQGVRAATGPMAGGAEEEERGGVGVTG